MKLKRFIHKRQRDHKTTMDLGILYPMNFIDVTMGQETLLKSSASIRFQPLAAPAMVEMYSNIVHFYVPYRIIWEIWTEFISMQKPHELPLTFLKASGNGFSQLNLTTKGSLLEYTGFPKTLSSSGSTATFLDWNFPFFWFMAYYMIWDEYFRDEEIQKDEAIDFKELYKLYETGMTLGSGTTAFDDWNKLFKKLYGLKRVNWGRDRFTSALLETETEPDIQLPVGSDGTFRFTDNNGQAVVNPYMANDGQGSVRLTHNSTLPFQGNGKSVASDSPLVYSGGLSGVDLVAFRTAMEMWNFKMNQTIYGTKYEDYLSKYGVRNMDGRLQKPEFIGGFTDKIRITDIIATDGNDLGKQGGHAYGRMDKRVFKHYAPENGVIISMMYIRPKAQYSGGLDRFFFKRDALDFPQLEFIHGYQGIYSPEIGRSNKGVTSIPKDENDIPIFGYEERYSEYRHDTHMVTGELTPGEPLSHWANPRQWTDTPVLNNNFLECNPSTNIWLSPNTDKAIVHYIGDFTVKTWLPNKTPTKFKF